MKSTRQAILVLVFYTGLPLNDTLCFSPAELRAKKSAHESARFKTIKLNRFRTCFTRTYTDNFIKGCDKNFTVANFTGVRRFANCFYCLLDH